MPLRGLCKHTETSDFAGRQRKGSTFCGNLIVSAADVRCCYDDAIAAVQSLQQFTLSQAGWMLNRLA